MTASPVPYVSKERVGLLRENARNIVSRSGHTEKHCKTQVSFPDNITKIKLFFWYEDRKFKKFKLLPKWMVCIASMVYFNSYNEKTEVKD